MTTKFESKTLESLWKSLFNVWGGLSIIVTIVSGSVYVIFPSTTTKVIAIIIIIIAMLCFFKISVDTIDKEFKKLENLESGQDQIIKTLDLLSNSTSLIEGINRNINSFGLVIPKICSSIETVEEDINSELIDFIFTKDKNGNSGNLILIVKCNKSIDHIYELTILSTDISVIKLGVDIPISKKYNVIEINDANNRDLETPYIAIKFGIKKGINIGIIKISIVGEIKQLFGIQFSLRDLELKKTIIEKTTLNFETT
ncbi:hypothetical protein [Clostridium estertheticum]|uniref:Uncharacterized protein n=1 Tax=Clostridium estertheticum TaxID=238834 RepID=A0AA47EMI1_9CLOT|nr:hypothetical protein [Clostridium estertheticum]MBU3154026.1 hypothetical protein [Clostridium estertheticum]WAG62957.1 hypothetical protein LL038_12270 [Clostridium estertheticum]